MPVDEIASLDGMEVSPSAPLLLHALRCMGYSLSSALADLVDNSVTAGASMVDILFSEHPKPCMFIVDNGRGMDEAHLMDAMRFGSRDPRMFGGEDDLGRFGLGMKTASISHCRRMTVATWKDGKLSVARWDIDECERRGKWWVSRPGEGEVPSLALEHLKAHASGTAVIWESLELNGRAAEAGVALNRMMVEARDHLALVFHRFLSGEFGGGLEVCLNGRALPRIDPFMEGHVRGQALHGETFQVEGLPVSVYPFVLPAPYRLDDKEAVKAGGRESFISDHGFYIYRGGRLVVPGGWFRIIPQDRTMHLARIKVDVPIELDRIWKVDIRKAHSEPPEALRPLLRRLVGNAAERSRRIYTFGGTVAREQGNAPVWERTSDGDGKTGWTINRGHPSLGPLLSAQPSETETLLRLLERSIPLQEIRLHMSGGDTGLLAPTLPMNLAS